MSAEKYQGYPAKIRFFKFTYSVHRWTGLFIGIQLLFWILGGFIMSVLPLEKVHGKHLAKPANMASLTEKHTYSLDDLISRSFTNIERIELSYIGKNPVYIVHSQNNISVYHGQSGKLTAPLTEAEIKFFANQYYLGDGALIRAKLHYLAPHEASRAKGKVWQVDFDDAWSTSLYLNPLTGGLVNTRSTMWRVFDFVWMLHIMDYDTRDDFNNPLLVAFSLVATLFTLSGFVLLYHRFRPRAKRRPQRALNSALNTKKAAD